MKPRNSPRATADESTGAGDGGQTKGLNAAHGRPKRAPGDDANVSPSADPPKLAASVFDEHLRTIRRGAKANAIDERVALLYALIDAPIRRRSLFQSATLLESLKSASLEELELHLRSEFYEYLADVLLAADGSQAQKLRLGRTKGGVRRAEQLRLERQERLALIKATEEEMLRAKVPKSELTKRIAQKCSLPVDSVRKARALIRKAAGS